MAYVPLHNHSDFSALDGLSTVDSLVATAKDLGFSAVALTDHATMSGLPHFQMAARRAEIKPILGCELYIASGSRFDKGKNHHLLVLARNREGYQNLIKLSTEAHLTGFYNKPRIDFDFLVEHSGGLIVSSGCLASEFSQLYLSGKDPIPLIDKYVEVFGENFFFEIQPRKKSKDQFRVNKFLAEISKRYSRNLVVATTDSHYAKASDYVPHDVLLAIQTRSLVDDDERFRFDEDTYYLQPYEVALNLLGGWEAPLKNTLAIADMIDDFDITFPDYSIPEFGYPDGYSNQVDYFHDYVFSLAKEKFGDLSDAYVERLNYELGIIIDMGFVNYFLLVEDILKAAEARGINWNIRGSAAASLVTYVMGLTPVDPIKNNLYFERFLNPDRISMPDIDIDFPASRREEMVEYIVSRYGEDCVAGIITHSRMAQKMAFKDAARAFGADFSISNAASSEIIDGLSIKDNYAQNSAFRKIVDRSEELKKAVEIADRLDGVMRQNGAHAAGYIISRDPIVNRAPLQTIRSGNSTNVVVQYDMSVVEDVAGLLKVDFLGLSTLDVINHCIDIVAHRYGDKLSPNDIPYDFGMGDDAGVRAALELISNGDNAGIFQIEGDGMSKFLSYMRPSSFSDVVAAIALYRPGTIGINAHIEYCERKAGRKPIKYSHPALEPILRDTYGLIIYQEQIMAIASELFGYSRGEADTIRKAVSKKLADKMEYHHQKFLKNGRERGISEEIVNDIWEQIRHFANYGFNRAHATDYAKLCVQTAYLKAKYPVAYLASLMNGYIDNSDKIALYLNECRKTGIEVLMPDINESDYNFKVVDTPRGEAVRLGLGVIKGVSHSSLEPIFVERDKSPFNSVDDFLIRVGDSVSRSTFEVLINAGVFDCFMERSILAASWEEMYNTAKKFAKIRKSGQIGLFDLLPDEKNLGLGSIDISAYDPVNQSELFLRLRRALGFPAMLVSDIKPQIPTTPVRDLLDKQNVGVYIVGGEIGEIKTIATKKGKPMAFVKLYCWHDASPIELVVFPDTWSRIGEKLQNAAMAVFRIKAQKRSNELSYIVEAAKFQGGEI